jgi:hypothetical protein
MQSINERRSRICHLCGNGYPYHHLMFRRPAHMPKREWGRMWIDSALKILGSRKVTP